MLAANDVSKKDLKKISKKIEKKIEKWEKKDQDQDHNKRKRDKLDNETTPGTSTEAAEKRLKLDVKTASKKDTSEKIISSLQNDNLCKSVGNEKRQKLLKQRDIIDTDNPETKYKVPKDIPEECEFIVDVNEDGSCNFQSVSDSPGTAINKNVNIPKNVPDECKFIDDINEEGSCNFKIVSGTINVNSQNNIPNECELVVDVNEEGLCDIKVVTDDSDIGTEASGNTEIDAFNNRETSLIYSGTCKSEISSACDLVSKDTDSVCDNCLNAKNVKKAKYQLQENQHTVGVHISCGTNDVDTSATKTPAYVHNCENQDSTKRKASACEILITLTDQQSPGQPVINSSDRMVKEKVPTIPNECDIVALDCEFVGVTRDGQPNQSALGRCSIVDYNGNVLCDIYARPEERITDYRTRWSGITRNHMKRSIPIQSALSQIANIISDKVVIGHAVHNDFQVLGIPHSNTFIRDTAFYCPLRVKFDSALADQNISLKRLALKLLGRKIQSRQHCSVEDARAAMDLYKLVRKDWEDRIIRGEPIQDGIVNNSEGKSDKTEKNRQKRQRLRLNRLRRNQSAVGFSNGATASYDSTSEFQRSKSDSNIIPQPTSYNDFYNTSINNFHSSSSNRRTHIIYDDDVYINHMHEKDDSTMTFEGDSFRGGQYFEDEYSKDDSADWTSWQEWS